MKQDNSSQQALTRVIRQLGSAISRQASTRWQGVRTAERNEGGRHVWRFTSSGESERYLHVSRQAMSKGEDPAATLLSQLSKAQWLDRLNDGPETSFILSPAGRLRPWPRH